MKKRIIYPRMCAECGSTYQYDSSFARHRTTGKCKTTQQEKVMEQQKASQVISGANNVTIINQAPGNADAKIIEEKLALEAQLEDMRSQLEDLKTRHGESKDPLTHIIYIVQTPHSFAGDLNVFKVGKTRDMMQRKSGYPKGTHIIAQFACINADKLEKKLLDRLRATFKERRDFGAEYFECPLRDLVLKVTEVYVEFEEGIAKY